MLAEILRQAGVQVNRWSLPSCQSVYVMKEGSVVQQGTPLVTGTHEIPKFDRDALITALRTDQQGDAGLVTTEKVGRVRTCKLGPRRLEEEVRWIERYRQLWDARFDELDRVVEELKRKDKVNERRKKS